MRRRSGRPSSPLRLLSSSSATTDEATAPRRRARRLLAEADARGVPRAPALLSAALAGAARGGLVREARGLFRELRAAGGGKPPSSAAFTALLTALKNSPQGPPLEEMLEVKRDMLAAGARPPLQAYHVLMDAAVARRDFAAAADLQQELLAAGLSPTRATYNRLLFALAAQEETEGGALPQVLGVLEAMEQRGIDSDEGTYTAILDVCAREGQVEALDSILEMMRKSLVPVTKEVLARRVRALGRAGRWREAVEEFRRASARLGAPRCLRELNPGSLFQPLRAAPRP